MDTFTASLEGTATSSALPHSRVTVLVELSSESSSIAGQPLRAVCVGLQAEPVEFTLGGSVECVEIRIPPSLALDIGLAVGDLRGGLAPADVLFGQRADSLADQLSETPPSSRPDLIRRSLRGLAGRSCSATATKAVRILERADLSRPVAEVVSDIGGSRSTLWRRANATLGMSPQEYLMLRRFEYGVDLLHAGYPIARAAVWAGYFDQAHFHRHVKRFARQTPGRLRRGVDATYVQDGDSSGRG